MRTPEQQAALEAVTRTEPQLVMMAQIKVLQCAVRALIASHPEAEKVRTQFDYVFSQTQAYPGAFVSADLSLILRDLVEMTFRPGLPASPDT